ncbi:MAG: hypothetical protein GY749_01115 [Desulfobacteraceae bacterium]|nr:hypothetical protein [Desulfobacteraceae bacterium]
MNNEFLDYVEDILDAKEKAEIVLKESAYELFGFIKGMVQINGDIVEPVEEKWKAE